jgi:hypothetical protein
LKAGSRILMCVTRMLFSLFARYEVPTCIIAYVCEWGKKGGKKDVRDEDAVQPLR